LTSAPRPKLEKYTSLLGKHVSEKVGVTSLLSYTPDTSDEFFPFKFDAETRFSPNLSPELVFLIYLYFNNPFRVSDA